FGERWGRHWLDVARYAESHGFTIDGARSIWKYREWVIDAFNDNMPFDRFTVEQLAGDLLLAQRSTTAPKAVPPNSTERTNALSSSSPFEGGDGGDSPSNALASLDDRLGALIATGFHRNTLINQEGGTDAEPFRVESIVDRVN